MTFRKYKNVQHNGFDSKREARRAQDLELLQKIGEIKNLQYQVKFELIPKQDGERPVAYVADFVYEDKTGVRHVADAKGMKTPAYVIKRKLMRFIHGVKVEEL